MTRSLKAESDKIEGHILRKECLQNFKHAWPREGNTVKDSE